GSTLCPPRGDNCQRRHTVVSIRSHTLVAGPGTGLVGISAGQATLCMEAFGLLVVPPVFKTGEIEHLGLAGSLPVRLRQPCTEEVEKASDTGRSAPADSAHRSAAGAARRAAGANPAGRQRRTRGGARYPGSGPAS